MVCVRKKSGIWFELNKKQMKKILCTRPFDSLFVQPSTNEVTPCCWINNGLGRLNENSSLESAWNNFKWRAFRWEMIEKSAKNELPALCPKYCAGKKEGVAKAQPYPSEMTITVANQCNLKCEMCWIFDDYEYKIDSTVLFRIIEEITQNSDEVLNIGLSGGEIFYSKAMREVLYRLLDYDNVKISFITNATIWDKKFWEILEKNPNKLNNVTISVDGWDRASYEKLRGRDRFDVVLKNIDKYIDWMKQHQKHKISINSIIQTATFRNLKDIVSLWEGKDVNLCLIPLIIYYKPEDPSQCYINELQDECLQKLIELKEYCKESADFTLKESIERNINYVFDLKKQKKQ